MNPLTLSRPFLVFFIVTLICFAGTSCSNRNTAAGRPDAQSDQQAPVGTSSDAAIQSEAQQAGGQDNAGQLSAGDWAGFLGTDADARSLDSVPQTWSDSENLIWKKELPGTGSSSPIIVGERLIVTCYVADGQKGKRQVLCFNKNDGAVLWSVDFPIQYEEDKLQGYITEHGYATNTPVSDGEYVYVFLGKGGVHCLSLEAGEIMWGYDAGKGSSNRRWGSASSLILYKNLVIVNAAEESKALIALDKATGNEVWREDADMLELTFGTPRIATLANGEDELVISVASEIWGMNPATGKLKWFADSPTGNNVSPSIIVDDQTVYGFGGYQTSGSVAVTIGGKDDVTQSNVLWKSRSTSYVATPLLIENRFYWIDDNGIAHCSSAEDGQAVYRQRVKGIKGGHPVYASPVFIGGKIYVTSRKSGTYVYLPGDRFDPLSKNIFESDESDFNASPAVSNNRLYLRSDQAIYCVGEP